MKKRFLLLAMVLFSLVGGAFAAELSYTITFKEWSKTDTDNSQKSTAIADIIASGAEYVSAIPTANNVYQGRVGRGIKFGTSSKTGQLVLTLANAVKPTRIVVNARWYGSSETTLKVNDKTFTTTGDFADYTVEYDGNTEVTSIDIATTSKRTYVKSVTVYYEGTVAAVEKPVITPASYEGFDAQEMTITCATADAKVYYTLDGTEPFSGFSTVEEYAAPFTVSEAVTVKAVAIKESDTSAVATAKITILKKIANTQEAPYTVAEANALAKNTDAASLKHANNKVYIKGIVTAITEVSTDFGNATYTIADETGATETLSVYRGKYLNDTKFDETNKDELTVGKEVVVYGNLSMYKEAPQVAQYNWLVSITTPVVPATPELKITSELKTATESDGYTYSYVDFGTVEYGQTATVTVSFEGKNLPTKYTYWDYDTDPNGVEVEKDNYVKFDLATFPFFDVELSEGGKVETTQGWMPGSEMKFYTFPIAADGSAKGTVTITLKKDFGGDPFVDYELPADTLIAVGSVAFGDEAGNYSESVSVMLELTKPAAAPELKVIGGQTGSYEDGWEYTYFDLGTIEEGQTASTTIEFEATNIPAKYTDYNEENEMVEADNFIRFAPAYDAYYLFDITVSENASVTEDYLGGKQYRFPLDANGNVKGSITVSLKKDLGGYTIEDLDVEYGEAYASVGWGLVDGSSQFTAEFSVNFTLTKPAQGGDGTALEDATVESNKAVKVLENGVVYIIKNGVKYTVTGVAVK